ncbi:MAG: hypothetical protein E7111_04625 [Bacteroidales bacterium]|nr:hypothetical protein [Bacteroidales bacterium]
MKIRNILLGLLAMTTFFSCNPDAPDVRPVLEVSTSTMTFNSYGGERPVLITANNAWTIEADAEWISFGQNSGEASAEKQQVMVYVDENEAVNADPRVAKITVKSGALTHEIEVTQSASEFVEELSVSVSALSAVAAGEALTFTVTSNVAWTVTVPAEVDWVTLNPASGEASAEAATVTVTIAATDVLTERTAVITVSGEGVEETISLSQAGKPLAPETMEGAGTEASPYLVKTVGNMLAMRDAAVVDGTTYFRLENDIDMAPVKNWIPINFDGTFSRQIHFDGGNFTLSNFAPATWEYSQQPATEAEPADDSQPVEPVVVKAGYHSLFGVLYGSVKNLKIDNVTISGTNACGVIGGYVGTGGKPGLVENVTITNASVTNAGDRVGGVCGNAKEATFKNVSFKGTVTSTHTAAEAKAGGFAGHTETTAVFENCSADVTVTGEMNDLGGFVGKITGNQISFTGCDVKVNLISNKVGKNRCGGFLGWNSSSNATFTDCHVLAGSTLANDKTWSAGDNGNFGGFIGFGDTTGSVVTISGCSASVSINVNDKSTYNGGFIGGTGYESTMTITDCHTEGSVNGANYVGGFFGAVQNTVTIERCWSSVNVTSTGQRVGSFVGTTTKPLTIRNCYSTGDATANGQQVGGILGYTSQKVTIECCYATGDITSNTAGTGGIVGTVSGVNSVVSKCVAWNENINCNRSAADKWAPGAVVGAANVVGTFKACYRRADMNFVDAAGKMILEDQDDIIETTPPQPSYTAELTTNQTAQQAYHGKAADSTDSLSAVAQSLGWSTDVWDFSGALPVLK